MQAIKERLHLLVLIAYLVAFISRLVSNALRFIDKDWVDYENSMDGSFEVIMVLLNSAIAISLTAKLFAIFCLIF
jgi:hypothetical protein